jgi:hypothetical protein
MYGGTMARRKRAILAGMQSIIGGDIWRPAACNSSSSRLMLLCMLPAISADASRDS